MYRLLLRDTILKPYPTTMGNREIYLFKYITRFTTIHTAIMFKQSVSDIKCISFSFIETYPTYHRHQNLFHQTFHMPFILSSLLYVYKSFSLGN